ncbi:polymorphic toxin-type HINT domain-containing protein [Nonomuraea helvata]|uniref:Polymorphic toxin-type HINT domain-containing protein n=1 Tax=Nonomuraea helvata TaxID=37484 RepID=A0ABV5S7E3_9ACTN
MRATTAAFASAAVVASGAQLTPVPGFGPTAAYADEPPYDLARAADVRAAQCLLTVVQRKGGQDLKAVAREGLGGTDDVLLRNAAPDYWSDPPTPLHTAYGKDEDRASAKLDELDNRNNVWEESLNVTPPKGYTDAAFQWIDQKDDPFVKVGLSTWSSNQYWAKEDDFYADQTPIASKESVDAVNAIAKERYPENGDDNAAWQAWKDMAFLHPMYADDARAFLARGGFPTSAPDPGSMEFRVEVENLKARYASCTSHNPPDPKGVLTAELTTASIEWQQEVDGQRAQRDTILAEEAQASADLQVASQALGEALGQSIIGVRLADWQAYWLKQPSGTPTYPDAAEFTKVKNDIVKAQAMALGRVFVAARAAQSAQRHADNAVAAQQAAYAIADGAGLPRGRGLLYGQQAVQVARASAAAALAVVKATETASNATRASAADSKTLMALAETQAHASQAEFRRIAAQEAAAQAKAAAEGAARQADLAAENAAKAKDAQARAEAAEATAKTAADDARAKREIAESERDNARRQRDIAAQQRDRAAAAEQRAQGERQVAAGALSDAQAAGTTAANKKNEALEAESKAVTARNNALQAESQRDAAVAKASAAEAYAAAAEGTDAAEGARTAATQARSAADRATTAATNARAAADDATAAASAAREAATRAEGSAARARSASDSAQRDVAITNAAVKQAHAAAADAIAASWAASMNVKEAEEYAKTAKAKAVQAKIDAAVARKEADAARVSAVKTAGFAYATAQAALAARDSALQVVKPANDAIELGSPYKETDASAGLAVLTAQASKTLAAQQAAVAQAKAAQAAKAAKEAKALADKADADAKAAAVAAAEAAESASKAVASLARARASADEAAAAAKAAVQAEANTVEYDRRATEDAARAESAATAAEGYATDARNSADEAELDAASAREAASAAEGDAATARDVATQAEKDATTAENAAAHAREAAEEAQEAARRTEEAADRAREADRASESGPTGMAGLITTVTEPWYEINPKSNCVGTGSGDDIGCDIDLEYHMWGEQDYYLVSCPQAGRGIADCTASLELDYLGSGPFDSRYTKKTHINGWQLTRTIIESLARALISDYVGCWRKLSGTGGSTANCGWVLADFVIPPMVKVGYEYAMGVRAALKGGSSIAQALFRLQRSGLPGAVISGLERNTGRALAAGQCFPGGTMVDTEHGPRAIEDIKVGDRVWAADPETGKRTLRTVARLFHRTVDSLVRITTAGGTLSATDGHPFWVQGKGWTRAEDLRPGDALQNPSGAAEPVQAVSGSEGPVDVYNFEVETDHTYYVYAGSTPVLVHNNCADDIVTSGDKLVLGVGRYGDELAEFLEGRALTLNQRGALGLPAPNGDGRPLWMDTVTRSVRNSDIHLAVSLDGIYVDDALTTLAKTADEAMTALLRRADKIPAGDWRMVANPSNNLGTAWEMGELRRAYRLGYRNWDDVEFYMTQGGKRIPVRPSPPPPPNQ